MKLLLKGVNGVDDSLLHYFSNILSKPMNLFQALDEDADGNISKAEFVDGMVSLASSEVNHVELEVILLLKLLKSTRSLTERLNCELVQMRSDIQRDFEDLKNGLMPGKRHRVHTGSNS